VPAGLSGTEKGRGEWLSRRRKKKITEVKEGSRNLTDRVSFKLGENCGGKNPIL